MCAARKVELGTYMLRFAKLPLCPVAPMRHDELRRGIRTEAGSQVAWREGTSHPSGLRRAPSFFAEPALTAWRSRNTHACGTNRRTMFGPAWRLAIATVRATCAASNRRRSPTCWRIIIAVTHAHETRLLRASQPQFAEAIGERVGVNLVIASLWHSMQSFRTYWRFNR